MIGLALLLLACAPAHTAIVPEPADTARSTPRCPGFGEPCDALPPLPEARPCGEGLATTAPADVAWPLRLSDLGCFVSFTPVAPGPGVVPFEVNSPLWTEGAHKQRFVALPPGGVISISRDAAWDLPPGGLWLKAFSAELADTDGQLRPLEIRAMLRTVSGWAYASYGWEEATGDLTLQPVQGGYQTWTIVHDGQPSAHAWYYPGDVGCRGCHRDLAEEVLGPHTAQLHREVDYGHVRADQLVAFDTIGLLSPSPATLGELPRLPDPYAADGPVAARARAWLHTNCAHCHRPGGFAPPDMQLDLRFDTPDAAMSACGVPSGSGYYTDAAWIIAPGEPDDSALYARLLLPGVEKMPPDGATWPDHAGVALVRAWITGMRACPSP